MGVAGRIGWRGGGGANALPGVREGGGGVRNGGLAPV